MSKLENIYITGISGTLGRAFTELLTNAGYRVTGIDRNETAVAKFRQDFPAVPIYCGDFAEADLRGYDLLIHLAAMKHIDLCENNPGSAIVNNVIKTYDLFQKASASGTAILFMSTDKAVEPASVYGYTKALIERLTIELGGAFARSGNILSSNGSVFGKWAEAVEQGKPLKLTHPDMRRYFISAENLAERVWQQFMKGGSVIIPEMDKDVTLLDLAEDFLKERGLSLSKYPIEYIGLRPGEKLAEKLTWETQ